MTRPNMISRVRRRARSRSNQEPSSRSSVTFISRKRTTMTKNIGRVEGSATAAPAVIASSQQTAANEGNPPSHTPTQL